METRLSLFIDRNQTSFMTELLSGHLDSVIISSNNKVDIIIESALGYLIMKDKDIIGTNYLCPRTLTQIEEKNMVDVPAHVQFSLNEPLIITISGPKNTTVDFIFRIENL